MIAALFERIGTTNKHCFEVGALDGEKWSNTWVLREAGWKAGLIECDQEQYAILMKRFSCARVETRCIKVAPSNFETVLRTCYMPDEPDLGVIDIDGRDYDLWQSMQQIRPRVMLIEFGAWNQPNHVSADSDRGPEASAGKDTMIALGQSKGYTPICNTYCNLLFVRSDCL